MKIYIKLFSSSSPGQAGGTKCPPVIRRGLRLESNIAEELAQRDDQIITLAIAEVKKIPYAE